MPINELWFGLHLICLLNKALILGYCLWNLDPQWKVWDCELMCLERAVPFCVTLFLALSAWRTLAHSTKPCSNVTFSPKPPEPAWHSLWFPDVPIHLSQHLPLGLDCWLKSLLSPMRWESLDSRDHVVFLVLSAGPGTGEGLSESSMKEWQNREMIIRASGTQHREGGRHLRSAGRANGLTLTPTQVLLKSNGSHGPRDAACARVHGSDRVCQTC